MNRWRTWTIRRRLVVAFVGVLIPYLAMAGLGLIAFRAGLQYVSEIHHEFAEELSTAWRLEAALDELGRSVAASATGGAKERAVVAQQAAQLRDLLTSVAVLYHDPEEQQAVEALTRLARMLEALAAEPGRIPGHGAAADAALLAHRMTEVIHEGRTAIKRIETIALREVLEYRERISVVARRTALGLLGAMALSLAGGVILAALFSRWIAAPISSIAEASHRLAAGDLSHRVEVTAGAELGETAAAFNTMVGRIEILQTELRDRVRALEEALGQVRTLSGLLPMCAWCRKIRSDNNYWHELDSYLKQHTSVEFSHSICPDCRRNFK